MKKQEVPQDMGHAEGHFREVTYAVDENGNYVPVLSKGWKPKNDALSLAWEEINEKAEKVLEKVREGRASPIAYFMELRMMDVKMLSQYTGYSKWRVRRHLKPKGFGRLDEDRLKLYAEVFDITLEEMRNLS